MFKWQLPTRKGTDVFPDVMKAPTAVRRFIVLRDPVTGEEEGSLLVEAEKIFARNYATILNFIAVQRTSYALGMIQYHKRRQEFPGGDVMMSILQGQEIVDINLYPELEGDNEGTIALLVTFGNYYIDSNPRIRLRYGSQVFPSEGYYSLFPHNRPPSGLENGGTVTDLVAENDMLTYGGYITEGLSASDHDSATLGYGLGCMVLNLARIIKKPKSDVRLTVEIYKDRESQRRETTGVPTGGYEYVEYEYLGAAWYEGVYWVTGEPAWGPYGDIGFAASPKEYKVNAASGTIRVDFPSGRPTGGTGYYTLAEVSAYGVSWSYENPPPPDDWVAIGTASTPENYVDRQWRVVWVKGLTEDLTQLYDRGNWGVQLYLLPDYSDIRLSWFGDYASSLTYEHGTYWWDRGYPEEEHTSSTWTLEQEAMFNPSSFTMNVTESGLVVEHEMTIPKAYWRKNLRGLSG